MGSPHTTGNTAALLAPFAQELTAAGHVCTTHWLYDLDIAPCRGCRVCQRDWTQFGCCLHDDAVPLFDAILACELLVLASPIYSWYCTAPMKALLDRMVYGMNKFYGGERGPALWSGRRVALLTTCGYPPDKGADLWEAGMQRYCKHSQLQYAGMLAERHRGYGTVFMDAEKEARVRKFAHGLMA